ncbi:MAG TPA: secretin N-terminal domain-containing protein, partial [Myxococcota bacterium]|nr:secretin N-terminal domain-containing protein [Myxococcota bacterium]
MQRWRTGFCALLALLLPLAAAAQEILLDFRELELARVVDAIGRQTGQRFIYDDSLKGSVSISVPQRATPQEALRVLDAALLLHGFAAVPGPDGVRKIVRVETAPGSSPWLVGPAASGSEAAVVTLIRLKTAPVGEVAKALREIAGKASVLAEDPQTNALLIAASEAQVRRLLQLARALDQASSRELRVMALRYRDPTELGPMLEEALAEKTGLGGDIRVTADARSGSLVVQARREDMERVHALLRTLDVPQPGNRDLHVVRVINVDAAKLAENLQGLIQDGKLARTPPPGANASAATPKPVRITVDPPTHSLVIQAPPGQFREIARTIAELDVPPPRVSIQVTVVEVTLTGDVTLAFDSLFALTGPPDSFDEVKEKGAILVGTGNIQNMVATSSPNERFVGRITSDPVFIPVQVGQITTQVPIEFGGIIRADQNEANFRTLIQPHLLMSSGDEHRIQSGDNIPVKVSSGTGAGGTAVTSTGFTTNVTFQRQDTGVDLRMTPKVLSEEAVALQMELEVSEVSKTSLEFGPDIAKRNVSATTRLRDGQIALIAALHAPERSESSSGAPYLSRIPVLGQLFTDRHETRRQSVL